jgi:hypothetical protein
LRRLPAHRRGAASCRFNGRRRHFVPGRVKEARRR